MDIGDGDEIQGYGKRRGTLRYVRYACSVTTRRLFIAFRTTVSNGPCSCHCDDQIPTATTTNERDVGVCHLNQCYHPVAPCHRAVVSRPRQSNCVSEPRRPRAKKRSNRSAGCGDAVYISTRRVRAHHRQSRRRFPVNSMLSSASLCLRESVTPLPTLFLKPT